MNAGKDVKEHLKKTKKKSKCCNQYSEMRKFVLGGICAVNGCNGIGGNSAVE